MWKPPSRAKQQGIPCFSLLDVISRLLLVWVDFCFLQLSKPWLREITKHETALPRETTSMEWGVPAEALSVPSSSRDILFTVSDLPEQCWVCSVGSQCPVASVSDPGAKKKDDSFYPFSCSFVQSWGRSLYPKIACIQKSYTTIFYQPNVICHMTYNYKHAAV